MFSCDFFEISKNTFFTVHLWTTASTKGEKMYRLQIVVWDLYENDLINDCENNF